MVSHTDFFLQVDLNRLRPDRLPIDRLPASIQTATADAPDPADVLQRFRLDLTRASKDHVKVGWAKVDGVTGNATAAHGEDWWRAPIDDVEHRMMEVAPERDFELHQREVRNGTYRYQV